MDGLIYLNGKQVPYTNIRVHENALLPFPKADKCKYSIGRGKYSYGILPLYSGFDIETTNDSRTKSAFAYIMSIAIANDQECIIYHCRKWDEFYYLIESIGQYYKLSSKRRLIILIANLGFEFQFIRKRLQWIEESFFSKEHRKPLLATTYNYIEFRECLSITGGNLDYLSQNYTTTKKLVDDLDYDIPRNSETPLTQTEMNYVNNDVIILSEFSYYILEKYVYKDKKFPMTRTGILRSELKALIKQQTDFEIYKKFINSLLPQNEKEYNNYFNFLFRGGYVHANIYWTDITIPNKAVKSKVISFDETSAYPAMMILKDNYPVTPFRDTELDLEYCVNNFCCIIKCTFYNIRRSTNHSIESESKCIFISENKSIDNGRVKSADKMTVCLTEQDYLNYCDFYKWDKMDVESLRIAERGSLPRPWLELLKRDYKHKNELKLKLKSMKDAKLDKTEEYAKLKTEYEVYKQRINSYYGMSVTKNHFVKWIYTNEKQWETVENEDQQDAFLSPFWGFWICANQRRTLLKLCKSIENKIPNAICYNDTDSLKAIYSEEVIKIVDSFNDTVQARKVEIGLTDPDFNTLGQFEVEHIYKRFKTEGAKRYLVELEDGTIEATIAGFPKSAIKNVNNPFKKFSLTGFDLIPELSKKKTVYYNDEIAISNINGEEMIEYSSAYIFAIPFTMRLSDNYLMALAEMRNEKREVNFEYVD